MAFTVETGAIVPGANALASVAAVDAYFADRGGNAEWTAAAEPAKQVAIVRATDYSERRFSRIYRGAPVSAEQWLSWPRVGAATNTGRIWASDAIPRPMIFAIAEYAARSLVRDLLNPAPVTGVTAADVIAGGGKVTKIRSKVDVIEEEFTFSQVAGGRQGGFTTSALASESAFPAIPAGDLWIEELLRSSAVQGSVQFGRVWRG